MQSTELVGFFCLLGVWTVTLTDAFRLYRSYSLETKKGRLNDGGWSWSTSISEEMAARGPDILTAIAISIIPWLFRAVINTKTIFLVFWSLGLFIFTLLLFLPRRYSVTKTTLYADGGAMDWTKFSTLRRRNSTRLVLQRKGWWFFAPLGIGGSSKDLDEAEKLIRQALVSLWPSESEE